MSYRKLLRFAALHLVFCCANGFGRAELNEVRYIKSLFDQGALVVTVYQGSGSTPPRFDIQRDTGKPLNPEYVFTAPSGSTPARIVRQSCYGNFMSRTSFSNIYATSASAPAADCEKVQTTYRFADYVYATNKMVMEIHEQTHPRQIDRLDFSRALFDITPVIVPVNPPLATADDTKGLRMTRIVRDAAGAFYVAADKWIKYLPSEPHAIKFAPNLGLDTSFGGTGIVRLSSSGTTQDIAVAADGKVYVLAGNNIWRLRADGTLDTTWGTAGFVNIAPLAPHRMRLFPDGRIVLLTGSQLIRLTATGAFDTFGTSGKFTLTKSSPKGTCCQGTGGYPFNTADLFTVLPDGKFLVAGTGFYNDTGPSQVNPFEATRVTTAGAFDVFGTSGWLEWEATPASSCGRGGLYYRTLGVFPFAPTPNPQNAIAFQVVQNSTTTGQGPFGSGCMTGAEGVTVVQIKDNGTLNSSFANSGKKVLTNTNVGYYSDTSHLGPDGKIYISGALRITTGPGFSWRDFAFIARMTTAGTIEAYGSEPNPTVTGMNSKYGSVVTDYTGGFHDFAFDVDGNAVAINHRILTEGPLYDLTFSPYDKLYRLDKNTGAPL